jgi:twitching motility protein PilT
MSMERPQANQLATDQTPGVGMRVLLEEMINKGASDLHISVNERPKLRIDGRMLAIGTERLRPKDTQELAYSVLTEQQKKRFEQDSELDFSFAVPKLSRFRGNVFRQRGSVAMAIRMIPYEIRSFEELGLPPTVARLAEKPRGLVLVTGPTGSGKSTTLAAMIDKINSER